MRLKSLLLTALLIAGIARPAFAADDEALRPSAAALVMKYTAQAQEATQAALGQALDLLGIRYRRGGTTPENGFDCSGFVGHVFREGLGLILPRSSKEISKTGEAVAKSELKPGDLVFFNTMRSAFSHVGIYLGENLFVHAPRTGGQVRIEDMRESYWAKRYNGARRVGEAS